MAAAFATTGLVDEAVLLRADKTIGEGGIAPLEGMALEALTQPLGLLREEQLGSDLMQVYVRN